MATSTQWVEGARPRTLPAAISPVVTGSGMAAHAGGFAFWPALLCLVVALALQVGVNYANDYSDGVRGTDTDRVGPMRLVGSGVARPEQVKAAAFGCFGVAALAGLGIVLITQLWWLLLVGAAAIAAAWFYTGGKRPYGYLGLGELFVFVFFGLVAVLGTEFVQAGRIDAAGVLAACAVGSYSSAVLVANNLRDIPTDTISGKRTLAVRLGDRRTRLLYAVLVASAFLAALGIALSTPWAAVTLLASPLGVLEIRRVLRGATGRDLIPVLAGTGKLQLAYAALLALALTR